MWNFGGEILKLQAIRRGSEVLAWQLVEILEVGLPSI
jgi:hypothetical protein